jgi:hypothetical protein
MRSVVWVLVPGWDVVGAEDLLQVEETRAVRSRSATRQVPLGVWISGEQGPDFAWIGLDATSKKGGGLQNYTINI